MRKYYRVIGRVSDHLSDLKTVSIRLEPGEIGSLFRPEILISGAWMRTRIVESSAGLEVVIPDAAKTSVGCLIDTSLRVSKSGSLLSRLIRLGFTEAEAWHMENSLSHAECHHIASYISEARTEQLRSARVEIARASLTQESQERD
jgi:hypothetical protein